MSGKSSNRNKKNQKKNKLTNVPQVTQVKSAKLQTNKINNNGKGFAKSEDTLKTCLKISSTDSGSDQKETNSGDTGERDAETALISKIQQISLGNDDVAGPSTSHIDSLSDSELMKNLGGDDENKARFLEGYPQFLESNESYEQYTYKYQPQRSKSNKSIKFTNQVTVLYFNGEDISESVEPLKKEIEQQLRNKEMRKEHLNSKGYEVDNVYLF